MKITRDAREIILVSGSGTTYNNSGGLLPAGTDTMQEAIDAISGGLAGLYLTVTKGGQGTVQSLGSLGSTETIDLTNANYFAGTLNANCTIGFTGWTNLKDSQITVELTEDGTGGWTPTFSGVTWIGGTTPTHTTTLGTVTHYVFLSRDGGTTIYGAQLGSSTSGGFLTVINGGGGTVQAHGTLGSTETIDTLNGNYHWGTLNANCTFTFTTTVDTAERWFTLELIENGTGGWTVTWPGSVVWLGGSTPTHTTTAGTTTIYAFFTRNGGTTWIGAQLGAALLDWAEAGDLAAVSTAAAAGTSVEVPRADHVHTINPTAVETAGHYELLMAGGISSPPEPLENGAGDDWLYVWVP